MFVSPLKGWFFWSLGKIGLTVSPRRGRFGSTLAQEIFDFYNRLLPWDFGHQLVRVGGDGDGGYVIPDDLADIERCFSPGCNQLANFESELYVNYAISSSVCDLKENLISERRDGIEFTPKLLGPVTFDNYLSIEDWIISSRISSDSDLILQMDIEGAEYDVLHYMSTDVLRRFRILIVEFHFLDLLKYSYFHREKFLPVFTRLAKHFDIVNINANNAIGYWYLGPHRFPPILEITFHRRDRRKSMPPKPWSSNLNQLNVPNKTEVKIPWSSNSIHFNES